MKLAVITPPQFTKLDRGSYHLILGQEAANSLWYTEHYKRKHDLGHYIIVDNGAAEPEGERVDFDCILEAANQMRADEIILPDVLFDHDQTLALTLQKEVLNAVAPRFRMVVPQGQSLDDWISCFRIMDHRMCFKSVGIAKHMETTAQGGRAAIIRWLVDNSFTDYYDVHLLGVHQRPFEEIEKAKKAYGWIRGIDTGAPIAYAQHGCTIGDFNHFSLDWNADAPPALVEENISLLQEACR